MCYLMKRGHKGLYSDTEGDSGPWMVLWLQYSNVNSGSAVILLLIAHGRIFTQPSPLALCHSFTSQIKSATCPLENR